MDTVAAAQVKLVNEVDAVKTSIISVVHNTVLSYKPDLSSISHEARSLIQAQDAKIEAQATKLVTLTTLVNGQGTRIEELKKLIEATPSTSPPSSLSNNDRALLHSQADLLNSQEVLINHMATIL